MNDEKTVQVTLTGELVQPIRLYYHLADKKLLIDRFRRLRCMDFDRDKNRWVWLYQYEAKTLSFQKPYLAIPKEMHPIVIGSFSLKGDETFLDLRSFDRATKAVPFFDKHVGPDAARITHAAVVNRLFDAQERFPSTLDSFFCSGKITERHPDESIREIRSSIEANRSQGECDLRAVVEQGARKPLPEIEKFPVHFYEDGIRSLEAVLRIRQLIAFEHWKGNLNYSFYDALKATIPGL